MSLKPCPKCGGREFAGNVMVHFYNIDVVLSADAAERTADWADSPAAGDQVTHVTCRACGTEQANVEEEI